LEVGADICVDEYIRFRVERRDMEPDMKALQRHNPQLYHFHRRILDVVAEKYFPCNVVDKAEITGDGANLLRVVTDSEAYCTTSDVADSVDDTITISEEKITVRGYANEVPRDTLDSTLFDTCLKHASHLHFCLIDQERIWFANISELKDAGEQSSAHIAMVNFVMASTLLETYLTVAGHGMQDNIGDWARRFCKYRTQVLDAIAPKPVSRLSARLSSGADRFSVSASDAHDEAQTPGLDAPDSRLS